MNSNEEKIKDLFYYAEKVKGLVKDVEFMDKVSYERIHGRNVLTMTKNI